MFRVPRRNLHHKWSRVKQIWTFFHQSSPAAPRLVHSVNLHRHLVRKAVLRHKLHVWYHFKPDHLCLADLELQACEQGGMCLVPPYVFHPNAFIRSEDVTSFTNNKIYFVQIYTGGAPYKEPPSFSSHGRLLLPRAVRALCVGSALVAGRSP